MKCRSFSKVNDNNVYHLKETAVACDIPPICEDPATCKWCNPEPLTLEGDIRYLKAHIETKDRQLAEKDKALYDAEFRIRIYRDAVIDAENENKRLREENERLKRAIEISVEGHTQTDKKFVEVAHENERLNRNAKRYQEEILELEQHNEELFAALNSVRNTLMRASNDIEGLIRVD